jgi:hypothetical protein
MYTGAIIGFIDESVCLPCLFTLHIGRQALSYPLHGGYLVQLYRYDS